MARRTLHGLIVVIASVLCLGCGDQAGSAKGRALETLIKREMAKALLEEAGNPNDAQIRQVASKLGASCEPADASDYDCAIEYGEELGERHCTVRPNPSVTRLETVRCGGAEPPVTDEEFVDCESVGTVVSADDPQSDVDENARPLSPQMAASPELQKADLRGVRVAATSDRPRPDAPRSSLRRRPRLRRRPTHVPLAGRQTTWRVPKPPAPCRFNPVQDVRAERDETDPEVSACDRRSPAHVERHRARIPAG